MASLPDSTYGEAKNTATAEIDQSPPRESTTHILLDSLNRLQTLSQTLFDSLHSQNPAKPLPFPHPADFLQCDENLAAAIQLVHLHQVKTKKIESLTVDLLTLQSEWRDICIEMQVGKSELETLIREGEERITAIHDAKLASLPYPELLAYAQSLSAFTSAPPHMPDDVSGQPPPPLFFPPFPNEEKMRRGRLNSEAPLGLAGEAHSVGRSPIASPLTLPTADVSQQRGPGMIRSYRPDLRPQQPAFFDLDLDLNPDL